MIYYKTQYADDPFYPVYSHVDWLKPVDERLRDFPLMLDIETTNFCNSHCRMCSRKLMSRKPRHMSFEHFRKIVDEGVREGAPFLRIHGWGEPTLHPEVVRQIKYASQNGVTTRLTTNGTMFLKQPNLPQDLMMAGVSEIYFSMQGLDKKSYEKIRTPLSFNDFVLSVQTVDSVRRALGTKTFLSITTSIFRDENIPEQLESFKDFFSPYADKLAVDFTHMTFLEDEEDVSNYEDLYMFQRVRRPCIEVLIKTHINSYGDILFCGMDYDGNLHKIGNLDQMTIKEAWHSPVLNAHRLRVRRDMKHAELHFCRHCFEFTTKYDSLKTQ